jgi:hypothetical protein
MHRAPARFRIVPDDYHVPYAGTAEDGRRFFLSDELFDEASAYVGLFLWKADGTFDEVRVDRVTRPEGLPQVRLVRPTRTRSSPLGWPTWASTCWSRSRSSRSPRRSTG